MQHFEEIDEVRKIKKHLPSTCDKCGLKIRTSFYDAYDEDWFSINKGHKYPEGGHFIEYNMELCETCSHELMNILKLNGFNIREEDVDY
jgi:hypothetical protein